MQHSIQAYSEGRLVKMDLIPYAVKQMTGNYHIIKKGSLVKTIQHTNTIIYKAQA